MKVARVFSSLKASAFASLALAFASFGDAFLYAFLPVNAGQVGVPVIWVGVLLSINRFVRIVANSLMVQLFAKHGMKLIMTFSVGLAILSTIGYSMASSLFIWIMLRVVWGLSFAAMRIGILGYAIQNVNTGTALGVSKSFQEIGPAAALLFAPLLMYYSEPSTTFLLLATLSLPALFFVWNLPNTEDRVQPPQSSWTIRWPSNVNSITFISAMLIDGLVVVALGFFFLEYHTGISIVAATTLAALYLGYRRICLVVLSPAGGWLADRLGIDRIFNLSLGFIILGLIVLVSGMIGPGCIIVFTFYSVNAAITPGTISRGNDSLSAVAVNATWRDMGAAIGTVAGGFLITTSYLPVTMLIAIFGLTFLLLIRLGTARKALKLFYAWR